MCASAKVMPFGGEMLMRLIGVNCNSIGVLVLRPVGASVGGPCFVW